MNENESKFKDKWYIGILHVGGWVLLAFGAQGVIQGAEHNALRYAMIIVGFLISYSALLLFIKIYKRNTIEGHATNNKELKGADLLVFMLIVCMGSTFLATWSAIALVGNSPIGVVFTILFGVLGLSSAGWLISAYKHDVAIITGHAINGKELKGAIFLGFMLIIFMISTSVVCWGIILAHDSVLEISQTVMKQGERSTLIFTSTPVRIGVVFTILFGVLGLSSATWLINTYNHDTTLVLK